MTSGTATQRIRIEPLLDGAAWKVVLSAPKANVLDSQMIDELTETFRRAEIDENLKAVCIEGEGPHFSFGASVEEHRPEQVAEMLDRFHGLFDAIHEASVPVLAAVRGQCLGGGLELAAFCHRVYAAPDAMLGQPEIQLGVFAPVASVILPERIGRGPAEDLCLSGRVLPAGEALQLGLVDEVTADPSQGALEWIEQHLLPRSAASLRLATRAVRLGFMRRFREEIEQLTRLYLDELMSTHDAKEGITAFLEKRKPVWRNA